MSHSPFVYDWGVKLDYQGILLLMWGSTIPLVYYGFPCQLHLQVVYWTTTTALAGLCSWATFHPNIGGPRLGHIRALLFAVFGLGSFLLPVTHGLLRHEPAEYAARVGLGWIGLTALFNGVGVVAYAVKVQDPCFSRVTTEAGEKLTGNSQDPQEVVPPGI